MKLPSCVLLGVLILTLLLSGCQLWIEGRDDWLPVSTSGKLWVSKDIDSVLRIRSFEPAQGILYSGTEANASLTLQNIGRETLSLWVGYSLQDAAGKWHDVPAEPISILPAKSVTTTLSWKVPALITGGAYTSIMAAWDRPPCSEGAVRLANAEINCGLYIYNSDHSFPGLDTGAWSVSSHTLGRSRLRPNNVLVEDNLLKIKLPEGRFDGGEIRSTELVSYGAYEVRMKLPHAPSSITGFFLYNAPDYYHEIDIEVVNDSSGTFYLVTYAEGKKQHEYIGQLPFDPTANFHNYRIEYYHEHLSFYVDDELIKRWTDGYTHEPMYLMLNCWFPNWLEGVRPSNNQNLEVEWIRY